LKDKIIAGVLITCTLAFFFYLEATRPARPVGKMVSLEESRRIFAALGGKPEQKPVSVFVTSWCPVCRGLEQELAAQNIPFVAADVEKNREAGLLYASLVQGQQAGVPLTVVGESIVLGLRMHEILPAYEKIPAVQAKNIP
jgi:glutaredoxin